MTDSLTDSHSIDAGAFKSVEGTSLSLWKIHLGAKERKVGNVVWYVCIQLKFLCVEVGDNHPKKVDVDNTQIQEKKFHRGAVSEKPWQENGSKIESGKEEKEKTDMMMTTALFPPKKIQDQRNHVDNTDYTDLDKEET